jgi:hypothetical protein
MNTSKFPICFSILVKRGVSSFVSYTGTSISRDISTTILHFIWRRFLKIFFGQILENRKIIFFVQCWEAAFVLVIYPVWGVPQEATHHGGSCGDCVDHGSRVTWWRYSSLCCFKCLKMCRILYWSQRRQFSGTYLFDKKKVKLFFTGFFLVLKTAREQKNSGQKVFYRTWSFVFLNDLHPR